MVYSCDYSQSRMLVLLPALVDVNTSLVSRQLHWFPVLLRIHYKLTTLVPWAVSPDYFIDDCQLVADGGAGSSMAVMAAPYQSAEIWAVDFQENH